MPSNSTREQNIKCLRLWISSNRWVGSRKAEVLHRSMINVSTASCFSVLIKKTLKSEERRPMNRRSPEIAELLVVDEMLGPSSVAISVKSSGLKMGWPETFALSLNIATRSAARNQFAIIELEATFTAIVCYTVTNRRSQGF